MSAKRAVLFLSAAIAFGASAVPAAADALLDAYQRVLADPTNTAVNLQYAAMAEADKEYRLALAAYERILTNDPNNAAATAGLQRVRRILQPASTLFTSEFGATYETNPEHVASNANDELYPYAKLRVRDERNLFEQRWRSTGNLWGEYHPENGEFSNALAFGDTGPVFDIPGALTAVHPAIGAAAAYFDNRFAYSEVNLSTTIEGYLDGAYQFGRVRGGYRQYDPAFTSNAGFYVGADGQWARNKILNQSDVVSISPWLLWSDIDGSVPDLDRNDITPGRYIAGGARFEYDMAVSSGLTLGAYVSLSDYLYATDPSGGGGGHREDFTVSPGVTVLFTNIFGMAQTDFRINYQYDHNDSNDSKHDYDDHTVSLAIVSRR